MFGSGAGRDRINYLVLVIISTKSDNGLDGCLYTRIIIRSVLIIMMFKVCLAALALLF